MRKKIDHVQLNVEINGKQAGKTYGELIGKSKKLKKELYKLKPGTAEFIKKSAELKKVNSRLALIRKDIRGVTTALESAAKKNSLLARTFKTIGPALGAWAIYQGIKKLIGGIIQLGSESVKLYNIQAKADAQLKSVIKSTNAAAGRSFEQLKQQAEELQKITLFGDEQTQQVQAILLTFTKISDEIYDKSVPAVLDMATALNLDLKSASLQVGKALNDPIKGVTALSRAGVQFTAQQKEQIKVMQESGNISEAQTIILRELETQFKGSAEAAAKAGTGGLQQLGNRIEDIKEGIGLLINNGLRKIQPFLEKVVSFFEKFTKSVISGEKATGKFSNAINNTIAIFKALGKIVAIVYNYFKFLFTEIYIPLAQFLYKKLTPIFQLIIEKLKELLKWAIQLPLIGTIISGLRTSFALLTDMLDNAGASFAGLKAAAIQAVKNIQQWFINLVNSAKILKLQLQKALTISADKKAQLAQEIKDLQNMKTLAAESGRTVGEAYAYARDKAIKDANAKAIKEATPPHSVYIPTQVAPSDNNISITNATTKTKKNSTTGTASAENLEIFTFVRIQVANVKKYIEDQFKIIQEGGDEKLDELEKQFLKGALTEEAYQEEKLLQKEANLNAELEMLKKFGSEETKEYRKKELEKLKVQKKISEQRIAQAKREQQFKELMLEQGSAAIKDALQFGIEFLGKDEKLKKKHADKIKALQIGLVAVNVATEISGIWKNANQNPLNAIIPGWGPAFAGIQTALALGRAALQTSKIANTQFFSGGFTGPGTKYQPAGIVHAQEYVLTMDEVKKMGGPAGIEHWKTIALKGYADGGLVSGVDTTPVGVSNLHEFQTSTIDMSSMLEKLDELIKINSRFPTLLKAYVTVDEFEAVQANLHDSIEKASI